MWPAFLWRGHYPDGIVFTLIDPETIEIFGYHAASRQAAYTVGFFLFLGSHRGGQLPDTLAAWRELESTEHDPRR